VNAGIFQKVILGFGSSTATATDCVNILKSICRGLPGPLFKFIDAVESPAAMFQEHRLNSHPTPIVEGAFCQPDMQLPETLKAAG
jgi:hypothetical protein